MVAVKLFLADEVYGRVVIGEIVRHRDDGFLNGSLVRTLFGNDKALSGVLLARRQLRVLAAAHAFKRALHRDGILAGVLYAGNAANRIGVTLADTLAPERVIFAVRQNRLTIEAVQREHTRVPTDGNHAEVAALLAGRVYIRKMLRNLRVRVKAVDDIKILCKLCGLLRQVVRAAAAQDHDVNLIRHVFCLLHRINRHAGLRLHTVRAAACENAHKLHIFRVGKRTFHAAAKISVSGNADSNHFYRSFMYLSKS